MTQNSVNAQILQEQVIEQREQKTTLQEKLNHATLQYTEKLCQVNALREKDQQKSHTVQTLQTELATARAQPQQDNPALMLRITDLQSAQKDVEAQKLSAEAMVIDLSKNVETQQAEIERIQGEGASLQLNIENANAIQQQLRDEHDRYRSEVEGQKAVERQKAADAAESQLTRMRHEYENKQKELSADLQAVRRRVQTLQAEALQISPNRHTHLALVCLNVWLLAFLTTL